MSSVEERRGKWFFEDENEFFSLNDNDWGTALANVDYNNSLLVPIPDTYRQKFDEWWREEKYPELIGEYGKSEKPFTSSNQGIPPGLAI